MDPNETMVDKQVDDVAADDALPEDVVEEEDESEESLESLNADDGQPADDEPAKQPQGTSEPGWIKQRVSKAVQKAVAEALAQQQAEFDRQMAPIREKMLEDEARELVRQGTVKDLETAKELVRYRQGQPKAQPQAERTPQPRNAQGQFQAREDPATTARINMLTHQADTIKAKGGPDVIGEFRNNPEIKRAIIAGEMDFYDVAEQMKQPGRKKPPSPMRSPNGASGKSPNAIDSMSDEQFERMEKRIREGARIRLN